MSAVVFSEVYLWSRPQYARLGMVVYTRYVQRRLQHEFRCTDSSSTQERARLNERSVYFRTMFLVLAMIQSIVHLFSDRDRVPYPLRAVTSKYAKDPTPKSVETPLSQIRRALPTLAKDTAKIALALSVPGSLVYFVFRSWAWNNFFSVAQYMYFLPKSQRAQPTGLAPFPELVGKVLVESFLLVFLWDFTNAAFSAYIGQEPLKKGKPLTADSNDPNGSLIVGLKAKKEFAKVCAKSRTQKGHP
jgi:nucleoporin NDC1